GGVTLDTRIGRARDDVRPFVGAETQQAFVGRTRHVEGENVTVLRVRRIGASVKSDHIHLGLASLVHEVRGLVHIIPDAGHTMFRNVFALNMARATYEGLLRLRPNERPYIITRAAHAGIQRYSTMWTGDNTATWDTLPLSIPMYQPLPPSGQPLVAGDIGGFIGRSNAELMTRWYQVGFLTPFCRNHAQIDAYDHEPWRFGAHYEDIIRKYLKLRYRLLPFLYSALEEAHRTGVPVLRPLLLEYQNDYNTLTIEDEFMIGADLLAAPILQPAQTSRLVYLPAGTWFDFWTGKPLQGGATIRVDAPLDTVPLFVRGGAIIPMGPEMNYVGEKTSPLTFTVYPDAKGVAGMSLY